MLEFVVSGVRSGIRGRTVQAAFVLGLCLIAIAYLTAGFSPRQPRTVALDIGLSGVRFTLIVLSLFWVQDLVTREIDRKIILHSLSLPISRTEFLLGRYCAVLSLILLASLILGFCLLLAALLASPNFDQEFRVSLGLPFWAALAGIVLDVAIVTAVALAAATVSTVAMLPPAVGVAFAIGGKVLGASIDYVAGGAGGDVQMANAVGPWLNAIRWLLPDLSRLDWRDWPLYGVAPDVPGWTVLTAVAYIFLILGLARGVFERREFG